MAEDRGRVTKKKKRVRKGREPSATVALWQKRTYSVYGTIMDLWTLKNFAIPIYVQFSRDKHIMDGAPEKLRRELEEELKQSGEEPCSHAWYHGAIPRQVNLQ